MNWRSKKFIQMLLAAILTAAGLGVPAVGLLSDTGSEIICRKVGCE